MKTWDLFKKHYRIYVVTFSFWQHSYIVIILFFIVKQHKLLLKHCIKNKNYILFFFYIHKKKCWIYESFWLPVLWLLFCDALKTNLLFLDRYLASVPSPPPLVRDVIWRRGVGEGSCHPQEIWYFGRVWVLTSKI